VGKIRFGTDGWRGEIAGEFTVKNLRLVVQGIMTCLGKGTPGKVVIGHDTRFMSGYYARAATEVVAGNGFKAVVCNSPATTPMVSHVVKAEGASGGIVITASHNPYYFNGVKFKAPYGGSASPETTSEIESCIGISDPVTLPYVAAKARGMVYEADFFGTYLDSLRRLLDLETLRDCGLRAVVDCMHGSAGSHAERLFDGLGLEAKFIRTAPDPYFGGSAPEPGENNLKALAESVSETGSDLGMATDGDADRLGVLDEDGVFVAPHYIQSLLAIHLKKNRGLTGKVVKTVSSSSLVDRVAYGLGLEVCETPVGFKHICGLMLTDDVLIGGEENGGLGIKGHIPERDGLMTGLLIMEMMACEGKLLGELVRDMDKKYGKLYHKRHDARLKSGTGAALMCAVKDGVRSVYGDLGIESVVTLDGVKVVLGDGSWVLFRASGTEPLIRIYSESEDGGRALNLIDRGKEAFLG